MSTKNEQKVALVTGAGQGIGRATALALHAKGMAVAVNDLDAKLVDDVCAEINFLGGKALAVVADLANEDDIAKIFKKIEEKWTTLTVLVNNAGIVLTGPIDEIKLSDWDKVMAINTRAVFITSQLSFRIMKKTGYGKIVNVASVAALVGGGFLGNAAYATSKAAVIGLTKALAREGGAYGIRANAVAPSLVDTHLTSIISAESRKKVIESTPLGRTGTAQEMANVIAFLASPESDYVSGIVLSADGGMLRSKNFKHYASILVNPGGRSRNFLDLK